MAHAAAIERLPLSDPMTASDRDPEFRFGRRVVVTQSQTAQPTYTPIALSPADFLDPEPGDEFVQGDQHDRDVARLAATLHARHRLSPFINVLVGPKLRWADGRRPQPAPDIALVGEIADPERPRAVLDLAEEPVTLRAVFEVTAPLFAAGDLVDKLPIYAAAGIPEYWVLDSGLRPDHVDFAYTIVGYRLEGDIYVPISLGAQGSLTSPAARVRFQVAPDGRDFVVADARTGQFIVPAADDMPGLAARAEAAFRAADIAAKLDLRP
jgi:Uma2 family endonuclease